MRSYLAFYCISNMKKVLLVFPDATAMAVFTAIHKISNAEVNYKECFLIAALSELQTELACNKYRAILQDSLLTLYSF